MKLRKTFDYFLLICLFQSCTIFFQTSRVSKDPHSAKIYSSDISNFYKAFDLVINDSVNEKRTFKQKCLSKRTKGLKEFYKSIRNDISNIDDLKKKIYLNFESFKSIYPNAVFPDVYFDIGKFSSNGTISKRGLLIGTEILCRTENTNTENWNKDMLREHISITVSHELIHFNQSKMEDGDTYF